MYYLGIDPGIKGAIAVISESGELAQCESFPTVKEKTPKGRNMSRTDLKRLKELFLELSKLGKVHITIEKPILMPGQNVSSTFNNGKSHGIVLTLLEVYFPDSVVDIISCKEWQDELIDNRTVIESKIRRDRRKALKMDSIAKAIELFPDAHFKKSSKSKVDSDGMTDAALIAYYGYQTNG
jgi:hypothetical protein